jgi:hypothetical protein
LKERAQRHQELLKPGEINENLCTRASETMMTKERKKFQGNLQWKQLLQTTVKEKLKAHRKRQSHSKRKKQN